MAERDIQTAAVKELRKRRDVGLPKGETRVFVTSDKRKSRHTRGLPDVLVALRSGLWCGLEFKSPTGKVSPEQEMLMAQGNIHVCRSVVEAVAAVEYSERRIK